MKCPKCDSTSYRKNGHRSGKQNYLCKNCGRQFLGTSFSQPLQNTEPDFSNGHTQTLVAQASELPLLKHLLGETESIKTSDSALSTAEELLQTLLSSDWIESSAFSQLLQKVQQFTKSSVKLAPEIALLLLDAENIKLDINTEIFLAGLSNYPLQVKIAFANWRNSAIGKQDAELYERGYQLVHVPGGKNSADGKMIALGSAILRQYQTVKEVFVCSSDGILTHLCNQLQEQGLTVYWIQRQNHSLKIENCNNGSRRYYSLAMATEIPSLEEFVQKIEDLIKAEQKSITERLSKLTAVATLFQEQCKLTLNMHRSGEEAQPLKEKIDGNNQNFTTTTSTESGNSINSQEVLEKVLIEIINAMKVEVPQAKISVSNLAKELQKVSGESANAIVKKLKLGSSFIKFLESCPTFHLKKNGKQYNVALAP